METRQVSKRPEKRPGSSARGTREAKEQKDAPVRLRTEKQAAASRGGTVPRNAPVARGDAKTLAAVAAPATGPVRPPIAPDMREPQGLLFDPDWYRWKYPDVAASRHDPVFHYVRHGADEGRNPNAFFDTGWYVRSYLSGDKTKINPFIHFLLYGYQAGNFPRPRSSRPDHPPGEDLNSKLKRLREARGG